MKIGVSRLLTASHAVRRRGVRPRVLKERRLNGVEFIDENGGGPGVRLRKRQLKKG